MANRIPTKYEKDKFLPNIDKFKRSNKIFFVLKRILLLNEDYLNKYVNLILD